MNAEVIYHIHFLFKAMDTAMIKRYEYDGDLYAIVLRSIPKIQGCRFFTTDDAPLQFGVQNQVKGYAEQAHHHPWSTRQVKFLHQVVHVISGRLQFEFFRNDGTLLGKVVVGKGETILLTERGHRMIVLEDVQTVTVKQGPFFGDSYDKILIQET